MKKLLSLVLLAGVAACGDDPAPKPAAQPAAPPQAIVTPPKPEPKAEEPKPDPNKELARKVKQALEGEAKIQAAAIDVTADSGRITLWGTAATAAERNRAGQVAAKVEGVASVDNQLKVVKGS